MAGTVRALASCFSSPQKSSRQAHSLLAESAGQQREKCSPFLLSVNYSRTFTVM
ncbi:MAG: hypothetical protein ACI8XU_002644, partial [Kiritimatiellia bacterium]